MKKIIIITMQVECEIDGIAQSNKTIAEKFSVDLVQSIDGVFENDDFAILINSIEIKKSICKGAL